MDDAFHSLTSTLGCGIAVEDYYYAAYLTLSAKCVNSRGFLAICMPIIANVYLCVQRLQEGYQCVCLSLMFVIWLGRCRVTFSFNLTSGFIFWRANEPYSCRFTGRSILMYNFIYFCFQVSTFSFDIWWVSLIAINMLSGIFSHTILSMIINFYHVRYMYIFLILGHFYIAYQKNCCNCGLHMNEPLWKFLHTHTYVYVYFWVYIYVFFVDNFNDFWCGFCGALQHMCRIGSQI